MTTATTSGVDSKARRPVWLALSELFLDTEIDDGDCKRIAGVLAESPYPTDELEAIYRSEVAPVLWHNLNVPAGVWDAFDPDWLCAEASKRAGNPSLGLRAAQALGADRLLTSSTEKLWRETAAAVDEIRSEADR